MLLFAKTFKINVFLPENEINAIVQLLPSEQDYMPGLAIDCIIFGDYNRALKALCTCQERFSQ
jgi:hypothetical protein